VKPLVAVSQKTENDPKAAFMFGYGIRCYIIGSCHEMR